MLQGWVGHAVPCAPDHHLGPFSLSNQPTTVVVPTLRQICMTVTCGAGHRRLRSKPRWQNSRTTKLRYPACSALNILTPVRLPDIASPKYTSTAVLPPTTTNQLLQISP